MIPYGSERIFFFLCRAELVLDTQPYAAPFSIGGYLVRFHQTLEFLIRPHRPPGFRIKGVLKFVLVVKDAPANEDVAPFKRLGCCREQPVALRQLGEVEPRAFENVDLPMSPYRAREGRPGAKLFNNRSTKRGPASSLLCCGWCRWLADQILAVIYRVVPPVMEKTTQGEPWIFSLIDARSHISDGMYWVWKWSCHCYHPSLQCPFPLYYTPNSETFREDSSQ